MILSDHMNLYLANKYKVFVGKGEHVGLCTLWDDPEIILKAEPQILDHVAILGSLYSREGVNIMLRNLCLNPQISHVLVWGKGNLSKTPIGIVGRETLERLWSGELNGGTIESTGFRMHPTISSDIVGLVTSNVELVDVSALALSEIIEKIKTLERKEPYMEPVMFEEFRRGGDFTFPSEEVGFVAHGKKVTDVWIKVVDKIMRYGTIKPTEYGNNQRELQSVTWVVEAENTDNRHIPEWPSEIKKTVGLEKNSLDKYISTIFFDPSPPDGTAYTYGNRLLAYDQIYNQTKFMIDKIKECESTRRAVSVLYHPPTDHKTKSPPCLTHIQILVSGDKLNMFVVYRSHDIFKAGISNAFGLRALQEHIAKETCHVVGKLAITSNSAHIYEEDWENAKKLCMCEIWERPPKAAYNELQDGDARGMVIISVTGDKIVADINSPSGEPLISIEGDSAKEVAKKMTSLDLLSRPDHWTDIGMELQKAEIAKRLGVAYSQDKPLKLNDVIE